MSWDIFVQDLPPGITSTEDIPDDFMPSAIGPRRWVLDAILAAAPEADFSDPTRGQIEGSGYSIEVNLGDDDPVDSFSLHVRGGDLAAGLVVDILERLNVRAIDPQSETGLFDATTAADSLRRWRAFRNQALK